MAELRKFVQWDDTERRFIEEHGWTLCADDGLIVIPAESWKKNAESHPDFFGTSMVAHPGRKQMVMPCDVGTELVFEHIHFLVAVHPGFPHMSYASQMDVQRRQLTYGKMTREDLARLILSHEYDWNHGNFAEMDVEAYTLEFENYHCLCELVMTHMYKEAREWVRNNF